MPMAPSWGDGDENLYESFFVCNRQPACQSSLKLQPIPFALTSPATLPLAPCFALLDVLLRSSPVSHLRRARQCPDLLSAAVLHDKLRAVTMRIKQQRNKNYNTSNCKMVKLGDDIILFGIFHLCTCTCMPAI